MILLKEGHITRSDMLDRNKGLVEHIELLDVNLI